MYSILLSNERYDLMMDALTFLEDMGITPGSFAPCVTDVLNMPQDSLETAVPFLFWIDSSGTVTLENKQEHDSLRRFLYFLVDTIDSGDGIYKGINKTVISKPEYDFMTKVLTSLKAKEPVSYFTPSVLMLKQYAEQDIKPFIPYLRYVLDTAVVDAGNKRTLEYIKTILEDNVFVYDTDSGTDADRFFVELDRFNRMYKLASKAVLTDDEALVEKYTSDIRALHENTSTDNT